jgi:hypothetical protein
MKTSSCKAKGRKLQNFVAKRIAEAINESYGEDESVSGRPMGQSGTDVRLVGSAKKKFPFDVEVKNQEKWSIQQWIDQAKSNNERERHWLLVCGKNRFQPVVVLDFETFMQILERKINIGEK